MVPSGNWNIIMRPDYRAIWYYVITFGAEALYLEPKDVIHFRANQIINPFLGIGLISQARYTVESEIVSAEYENNYMIRDGAPNMVVIDKSNMTPEQARAKGNEIRSKFNSGVYRNGVFYAWGDVSVEGFKTAPKDISYVKPMNRDQIISIMQSCPEVLGLSKDAGNRAIADRSSNNYYKIVNSRAQEHCDTINMQWTWTIDTMRRYQYTFTPYPTGDIEEVGQQLKLGIITPNEARRDMGRDIVENDPTMDTFYIPSNYVTIGDAFEGIAPQITAGKGKQKKNLY